MVSSLEQARAAGGGRYSPKYSVTKAKGSPVREDNMRLRMFQMSRHTSQWTGIRVLMYVIRTDFTILYVYIEYFGIPYTKTRAPHGPWTCGGWRSDKEREIARDYTEVASTFAVICIILGWCLWRLSRVRSEREYMWDICVTSHNKATRLAA